MNKYLWWFFGIVGFVLFVLAGNNPMDEINKKAGEMRGDRLVKRIEQNNERSQFMNPNAFGAGGGSGMSLPAPDVTGTPYQQPAMQYRRPSSSFKAPGSVIQAPPQSQDGYYPPPPVNENRIGPQSLLDPENLKDSGFLISNTNQRIAFMGTRVYLIDKQGQPSQLPDGKYPVFGGRLIMTVRGGQKVEVE